MKKAFLAIALLVAIPAASLGGDGLFDDEEQRPLKTGVHLYPFAEDYSLKEIFQGARVSEEDGELYGAGAILTVESGSSIYRLKGEYFQGTMDANGVSAGVTWATDVDYNGVKIEGDGGLRVPFGRASIVPNMGLGYRWWRRDYRDSATVIGLLERWHTFYFKLGALAEYDIGGVVVPYVEAAVRIGIFNNNEIKIAGERVSMNPSGRVTPYAEAGLRLSILKGAVYYERMEFAQSDPAPAPGLPPGMGLVQPEIKADIYGARVGISF